MNNVVATIVCLIFLSGLLAFELNNQVDQPSVSYNDGDCIGSDLEIPISNSLWAIPAKSIYQVGETINFLVQSDQGGKAEYFIREDKNTEPIIEGELDLQPNSIATISATLDHPGFLLLQLTQNEGKTSAGVGIDPCNIQSLTIKPNDFDLFWEEQLSLLATIPVNPKVTKREDKSSNRQTTYKIELDNIDGKKVYGWVSIPNCEGPFSTVFTIPSYGRAPIGPVWYDADDGVIAATMSIHNYDCEVEVPKEIAYQPDNHYFNRNENYYRAAILGGIQMINYLFTLPEFDGENLGITGVSQGGGLAIMIAGLDQRIKFLAQAQATFCNHIGILENRPTGFPYWLVHADLNNSGLSIDQLVKEVSYYDAINFAKKFKGTSFHTLGYKDDVCPPTTVFAAYNAIGGEKTLLHGIENAHDLPGDFWPMRNRFWQDHMPIQKTPNCERIAPIIEEDTTTTSIYDNRVLEDVIITNLKGFKEVNLDITLLKKQNTRVVLSSFSGQILQTKVYKNQSPGKRLLSLSYASHSTQIGIVSIYLEGQLAFAEKIVLY